MGCAPMAAAPTCKPSNTTACRIQPRRANGCRGHTNGSLGTSQAKDVGTMSEPDRTSLPIRRPPFGGVSNKTLDGSKPDWNLIGHPEAPEGSPNVLLVLIDDAGFGNPSTFGGPIDTPRYTQMAETGLRYNRFHVTALCSPTRAAMLTGRNQHRVGFGL